MDKQPLILIVGVCAAGKSTLSQGLQALGYNARSFAQEHSVSPYVWQRRKPDFLILLDCEYETVKSRKLISWGMHKYKAQKTILADAHAHAHLVVKTDKFTPQELIAYVDGVLQEKGFPKVTSAFR